MAYDAMNTVTRSKRLKKAEFVVERAKTPQGFAKENRREQARTGCEGRRKVHLGVQLQFKLCINFVAKRGKTRQSTRMSNLALRFYKIKHS